ncbi:MAG: cytochrome c biogenesis protein CcdA [Candidatus Omnitrophica bacterium]|nr:cytochrome c biogenesis protein CcdA [Candidatus Omnitrophota bacterium]MDD5081479.1 cytochrome c biogenesis protein CcdA [Candidatus Omnitrophota bacterium]MDD5441719.1 cytochrome c biogenesis protein CcdA [Candidatus Omnitrophota bacterium]
MHSHILNSLEQFFIAYPAVSLLISFVAGVVASFSPCVYPLIPVTLGIVGARKTQSIRHGAFLSFIFILGIATTYTCLGVVAAAAGAFVFSFFINPVVYFVLGALFIFFGLILIDLIKFKLPFIEVYYMPKKGVRHIFLFGLISGFAMVPCNFPVLGFILTVISTEGRIVYGALALFCFSLGYGFLLFLCGTFAQVISKLPKQGVWTIMVQKVFGVFVFGAGIYFIIKAIGVL